MVMKISGHDCHAHQPGSMLLIIKKRYYVIIMFIYPVNHTHVDFIPHGHMGGFVKRSVDYVYIC